MDNYLSNKLKVYRKNNELTQKQLANILYVSDKTVSKWECGAGQPDIETMKRISKLLNISLDDLLNEKEPINYSEYKSNWLLGAIPFLHIVLPNFHELFKHHSTFPKTATLKQKLQGIPSARGVISIGLISSGGISIGFFSRGILSFGLLSIGFFQQEFLVLGLLWEDALQQEFYLSEILLLL